VEAVKREISSNSGSSTSPSKDSSPDRAAAGLRRRSIMKAATSASGRKRRKSGTGMPRPDPDLPHGTSLEPSHNTMPHSPREPNVLAYSPDEKIAVLARNIDMMEDELRSNGAQGLVWPQNVTYRNYFDYVFFPTLVYQLEYPRTDV
jgi:sterol O-acyltransferase